jgi:hypothetical protein
MQSNSRSADPAVRSKGFITILKEKLHEGGLPGLWTVGGNERRSLTVLGLLVGSDDRSF